MTRKEIETNCPDGYKVSIPGQTIDMLGAKEIWLIHSNNPEPFMARIPQDLVDYGYGASMASRPKGWGYPIYYKVVIG